MQMPWLENIKNGTELYRWIAKIILIVGGINMGLVGLANADLILGIFGHVLGRLIFIIVGIAAGYECYLFYLSKFKKTTTAHCLKLIFSNSFSPLANVRD